MADIEFSGYNEFLSAVKENLLVDPSVRERITEAGAKVILAAINSISGDGSVFNKYAALKKVSKGSGTTSVYYVGNTQSSEKSGKPYRAMGAAIVYTVGREATDKGRSFGKRVIKSVGKVKSSQKERPYFADAVEAVMQRTTAQMQAQFDKELEAAMNERKGG